MTDERLLPSRRRPHNAAEPWLLRRYRRAWRNLKSIWVIWQALLLGGLVGATALWTALPDGGVSRTTVTLSAALLIVLGGCWCQSLILIRARRYRPWSPAGRGGVLFLVLWLLWLAMSMGLNVALQLRSALQASEPLEALLGWSPRVLLAILFLPFAMEGSARAVRSRWFLAPFHIVRSLRYWIAALLPSALVAIITEGLFTWRPDGNPQYLFMLGIGKMCLIAGVLLSCICLEISLASTFLRDWAEKNATKVEGR